MLWGRSFDGTIINVPVSKFMCFFVFPIFPLDYQLIIYPINIIKFELLIEFQKCSPLHSHLQIHQARPKLPKILPKMLPPYRRKLILKFRPTTFSSLFDPNTAKKKQKTIRESPGQNSSRISIKDSPPKAQRPPFSRIEQWI